MATSFRDRAYEHIRSKILGGGFVAGERLSEATLADEIGISRTPIREALHRLASEGLATQLPHYGVFVRQFDRDELAELYDLREMLESYAAGRAAERRTEEQAAQLRGLCAGFREVAHTFRNNGEASADDALLSRQNRLDVTFHTTIFTAAGGAQTMKVASDLRLLTQLCGRKRFVANENLLRILAKTWREHEAIAGAVARGDSDAAHKWMSRHLRRGKAEGLAAFDRQQEAESTTNHSRADHIEHYRAVDDIASGPIKT